jgi:acyl-CoA hydrolase
MAAPGVSGNSTGAAVFWRRAPSPPYPWRMDERVDERMEAVVEGTLERLGRRLVMGLPLGLGKPNRLVNAFYRRARSDPKVELDIVTALSLDPPEPGHPLERRLLGPFLDRHFGTDYPRLEYVADQRRRRVPANVRVIEFYVQSGSALGNPLMQRHYISSNYTHVARDLVDRGLNLVLQLVAAGPPDAPRPYSLSCNPDVTLEAVARMRARPGHAHVVLGQLHPDLPYMHGDALVDEAFFDEVLPAGPSPQRLFALPRTPVSIAEHWVGLHAATLIPDGGTLQIGIGALGDAIVHALLERHRESATFRALITAAGSGRHGAPPELVALEPFTEGLYGASEMFMDGFMHLYRAGILRREVFDDPELQALANAGRLAAERPDAVGTGSVMDAAFLLGTHAFYDFLRALSPAERPRFRMDSVGRINQLYGGSEALEIMQRRGARFFNTCMMVTATGAAVSDGVEDHQAVSGVGGQYNFVAMAHAMRDGRSALLLRSTRTSKGNVTSNIVWEYGHTTIPRHLRDLVVTEYGVADLRGRTDDECVQAMVEVADARFQDELVARARAAGKLDPAWEIPERARRNAPDHLEDLARRHAGLDHFPRWPFGSDLTDVELRLVPALRALQAAARQPWTLAGPLLRGRPADHSEALAHMGLDRPRSLRERAQARLIAAMLEAAT